MLPRACREYYWSLTPFQIFYVSGACHLPFSLLCTLFVGVSEQDRSTWRHLDVFFIFTSAGKALCLSQPFHAAVLIRCSEGLKNLHYAHRHA